MNVVHFVVDLTSRNEIKSVGVIAALLRDVMDVKLKGYRETLYSMVVM